MLAFFLLVQCIRKTETKQQTEAKEPPLPAAKACDAHKYVFTQKYTLNGHFHTFNALWFIVIYCYKGIVDLTEFN